MCVCEREEQSERRNKPGEIHADGTVKIQRPGERWRRGEEEEEGGRKRRGSSALREEAVYRHVLEKRRIEKHRKGLPTSTVSQMVRSMKMPFSKHLNLFGNVSVRIVNLERFVT